MNIYILYCTRLNVYTAFSTKRDIYIRVINKLT
jgi:hypothetical protein